MTRNIAVVGCGAIAQEYHLGAIARRRRDFDRVWVVDPSEGARTNACTMVEAEPKATLRDITDDLHFVIVATPNDNHFSVAHEALSRGANVLLEKPFVIWPDEGRKLIALAMERGRLLVVNQTRRFFPHTQELKKRISSGEFGELRSIVHYEGVKLMWPYMSGAAFSMSARRTGVIMDMGVHVLDFYQYLLSPTWQFVSSTHDGFHGPEGLAELHLKADGVPLSGRLSRYCKQENVACMDFEDAQVSVSVYEPSLYSITTRTRGRNRRRSIRLPPIDLALLGDMILGNFIRAAMGDEQAMCDAQSSLPVIEILDEIYRRAEHYPETPGKV